MTSPNCYLVSYDVCDPKRLRRVYNTLLGFGRSVHYSVFLCDLFPKGKAELVAILSDLVNHDEDRVMIVNLGPTGGRTESNILFIGHHPVKEEREAIII